jgi:hypothetical protein
MSTYTWKVGVELCAYVTNKWRKGKLVSKKGTKWRFQPRGWRKDVPLCPIRSKWRYVFRGDVVQWTFKLPVVLIKETLKPFAYRVERFGRWKGAKMSRTAICRLPVWQFEGTNRLVVGHVGSWHLARTSLGKLVPFLEEPKDESFFVGRGELSPKKFKCLKTSRRAQAPRVRLSPVVPRFSVPSRDELG